MNYRKYFKQALLFSGLIFGTGFLNFWGFDFYVCLLSASCFLFMFIHDAGRDYMELTRQPARHRHAFKMVVNPFYVFVCALSLLYVIAGEMHWFFLAVAGFLAFILFAVDGSPWMEKRSKKD